MKINSLTQPIVISKKSIKEIGGIVKNLFTLISAMTPREYNEENEEEEL